MSDVINLTIDGHKLTGMKGDMLIEVADKMAFIYQIVIIQNYQDQLTVECVWLKLKKRPKTLRFPFMKVWLYTQSKKTIESQKAVMEFLLVRHPLHYQFVIKAVSVSYKIQLWTLDILDHYQMK